MGLRSKNNYAELFLSLLLGNTLFVLLVSLFYTKGNTINLGFVILSGFYLFFKRDKISFQKIRLENPFDSTVLLALSLVFLLRFFSIYSSTGIPLLPHGDQIFYANCSNFLKTIGCENSSVDYTLLSGTGVSPYHYFELWQTVGISSLFHANSALSLILVTIPSGMFMIIVGFMAIASEFSTLSWWTKLFCAFSIFMSGLSFYFYTKVSFMSSIGVYTSNAFDYPKLIPLYLFALAGVLFSIQKNKEEAILAFLCLPVVSIATSVGILAGIFSFLLFDRVFVKKYTPNLLLSVCIVILFIFTFYKIFNHETGTHVSTDSASLLTNFKNIKFLTTCVNIVGGASIQFALIALPYLLLFLFLNPRVLSLQYEYIGLFFIVCFSLAGWALMHEKLSSVQVFSNLCVTMLNVLLIVGTLYLLLNIKQAKQAWMAGVWLVLIGIQQLNLSSVGYRNESTHAPEYLSDIHRISSKLSPMGAFILSEKSYEEIGFSYISNFVILGNDLIYLDQKTFPMSISPFSIRLSSDSLVAGMQETSKKNTPFYLFVEKQKQTGAFVSLAQSQVDFIKTYKINYLILDRYTRVPELLEPSVKNIITDKQSGERFILLK
jgi:hypothetical protein